MILNITESGNKDLLHVNIKLLKQNLNATVDTASQISCINSSLVKKNAKIKSNSLPIQVLQANGKTLNLSHYIETKVEIKSKSKIIKLYLLYRNTYY